jgi:hypothetical protein
MDVFSECWAEFSEELRNYLKVVLLLAFNDKEHN